jgi:hypothetical protein
MRARRALSIIGLVTTLAGAGLGTCGMWVSYENQNLLWQTRFALWGFGLITSGTLLQISALELELWNDAGD